MQQQWLVSALLCLLLHVSAAQQAGAPASQTGMTFGRDSQLTESLQ